MHLVRHIKLCPPAYLFSPVLAEQMLAWMQREHGRLPAPYNQADADALIALAQKLAAASGSQSVQLDEAILRRLSWTASGDLSPMAAVFGGIVGQEAVKAISGKFHPIDQFLYFDAVEALPAEALPAQEIAPQVRPVFTLMKCSSLGLVL